MSVATGRGSTLDEIQDERVRLLAELRDVDHWRRLVSARLDLAVAAVAGPDEPISRDLPFTPALPTGLRSLVGLCADPSVQLTEVACLEPLRTVLDDLDCYALALRSRIHTAH